MKTHNTYLAKTGPPFRNNSNISWFRSNRALMLSDDAEKDGFDPVGRERWRCMGCAWVDAAPSVLRLAARRAHLAASDLPTPSGATAAPAALVAYWPGRFCYGGRMAPVRATKAVLVVCWVTCWSKKDQVVII